MLPYFKGYLQQILSKEHMVVTWRFGSTLWGIYIFTSFISVNQKIFTGLSNNLTTSFKCKSRNYMWNFFEISQPKISILVFLLKLIHVWSCLGRYGQARFSPTILKFKFQDAHVDILFPSISRWKIFFFSKGTFEDVAYIYTSFWIEEHIYNTSNKVFSREFDLKSSILSSVYKLTKVFCVVSLNRICWENLIIFSSLLFNSLCVRNWVFVSSL